MTEGQEEAQVSESQIAVHWREEEYYYPPESFVQQANAADPAIFDRFSEENFPDCFKEYSDMLSWDAPWETILDTSNAPFWKWFVGGRLNASYNCVDRHLATSANKAAIIWVPEPESVEPVSITYRDLYHRVNEFAALLRDFGGVKAGDRVTLHMPMVAELPVVMLACARVGVVHSEGGGRDFFVDEVIAQYRGQIVEPVSMPAEAPLFLMYTSGTTGRPKGAQHSTGGYLAYV